MTIDPGRPIYNVIQQGPLDSMGKGGLYVPPWYMPQDGIITAFEVKWGDYVNQLLFHFTSPTYCEGVISLGGWKTPPERNWPKIKLADGEVITKISGTYGQYIHSVEITTSMSSYGPYGTSGPSSYQYNVPANGQLIGLVGRTGWWVDALGVMYGTELPIE